MKTKSILKGVGLPALLLLISLMFGLPRASYGQTVVYSEDFGTPGATIKVGDYDGWSNQDVTYTSDGTCDLRITTPSSDYAGASAGGHVMINNAVKWLQVSGINTEGKSDIALSFGLRKGTNAETGSTFKIQYSTNGTDWSDLSFEALPTGSGTAKWYLVTVREQLPATENLRLKFSSASTVEFRLDDVKMTATEEPTFDGAFANVADLKANLANWTKGDKIAGLSLAGLEITCVGMTSIFVRDESGFMAIPYSMQAAPPSVVAGEIATVTFGVTVTEGVARINADRRDNPSYSKTGDASVPYAGTELTLTELKNNSASHIGELVLLKNVVISGEENNWKVSKDGNEFALIGNMEDKAYSDATVTGVFVNAQDGVNATKIVDNTPAMETLTIEQLKGKPKGDTQYKVEGLRFVASYSNMIEQNMVYAQDATGNGLKIKSTRGSALLNLSAGQGFDVIVTVSTAGTYVIATAVSHDNVVEEPAELVITEYESLTALKADTRRADKLVKVKSVDYYYDAESGCYIDVAGLSSPAYDYTVYPLLMETLPEEAKNNISLTGICVSIDMTPGIAPRTIDDFETPVVVEKMVFQKGQMGGATITKFDFGTAALGSDGDYGIVNLQFETFRNTTVKYTVTPDKGAIYIYNSTPDADQWSGEAKIDDAGASYLYPSFKPAEKGSFEATLTVTSMDGKTTYGTLPLKGVCDDVVIEKAVTFRNGEYQSITTLDLGSVMANEKSESLQVLFMTENIEEENVVFTIENGETAEGVFYIDDTKGNKLYTLTISSFPDVQLIGFNPTAAGDFTATLVAKSEDGQTTYGTLSLTGKGVAAPDVEFTVNGKVITEYDFGTAPLNSDLETYPTVGLKFNNGLKPSTIKYTITPDQGSIYMYDDGKKWTGTIREAMQGTAVYDLYASFNPTTAGEHIATMTIASADGNTTYGTLDLKGICEGSEMEKGIVFKGGDMPPSEITNLAFETVNVAAKSEIPVFIDDKNGNLEGNIVFTIDRGETAEGVFYLVGPTGEKIYTETVAAADLMWFVTVGFEPTGAGDFTATLVAKDEAGDVEYGQLPLTGKGALPTTFATLAELNAYLKVADEVEDLTFTGSVEVVASTGQGAYYVRDDSAVSNAFMLDEMNAVTGWTMSNFTFNIINYGQLFVYPTAGDEAKANPPYSGEVVTFAKLKNSPANYTGHLIVIEGVDVIIDKGEHYVVKGDDRILVNQDNLMSSNEGSLGADETWTKVSVTGIFLGLDGGIMPRDRADFKGETPAGPVITSTLPSSIPAGQATEFTLTFTNVGDAAKDGAFLYLTFDSKKADVKYKRESDVEWSYPITGRFPFTFNFKEGAVVNFQITPTVAEGQTIVCSVKKATTDETPVATLDVAYTTTGTIPALSFVASEDLVIGQYGPRFNMGDDIVAGQTVTKTFEVTVSDLTADITLTAEKTEDYATEGFSFSPATIAQNTIGSVTITVTYVAPEDGPATSMLYDGIVFSGGGLLKSTTVTINGTVTNPNAPNVFFVDEMVDFDKVNIGETKTLTTKIKVVNTTKPVTLKLADMMKVFTVTPTTIEPSGEGKEVETELTIIFTPKADPELMFSANLQTESEEIDMKSLYITGEGVEVDTEKLVTITPASWDGGYAKTGKLSFPGFGPTLEVFLKNINEVVNITVEPAGVFAVSGNSTIPANKRTYEININYDNVVLGVNEAKVVLTGVTSGTKWAESTLTITGIEDPTAPITVKGIAELKKYAINPVVSFTNITLEPLDDQSPITITGINLSESKSDIYVQDVTGGYFFSDRNKLFIESAQEGDVLSNIKLTDEVNFMLTAVPTAEDGELIRAKMVKINDLKANADMYDYTLVVINDVDYTPGESEWASGLIEDANGNELDVNNSIFLNEAAAEGINVRGIAINRSYDGMSIAPRSLTDFIVPVSARLTSTIGATIAGGTYSEFDLNFTAGSDEYESLSISVEATKGNAVALQYLIEGEEYAEWTDLDLSSGATFINPSSYKTMTIKMKIAPLTGEANTLTFNALGYIGMFPNIEEIELAATTATYTVTGTVPMVTLNPTTLDFGDVEVNTTKTLSFTVTPSALTGDLAVALTEGATGYTVDVTSIPQATTTAVTVNVTFAPTEVTMYWGGIKISGGGLIKNAVVALNSNVYNPTAPRIETSVKTLNFGDVAAGATKEMTLVVTPHNLTKLITLASTDPSFTVTPAYIEPNAAATTVTVRFAPTKAAEYEATLSISGGDFGEWESVGVSLFGKGTGAGIPTINITPAKLAFSAVFPGEPVEQSVTVNANDLAADMTIAISGANAALFTFDAEYMNNRTGGTLYITYTPNALGTHSATLTITAGSIVKTVALSGTATSTNAPVITLSAIKLDFTSSANVPSAAQTLTVTTAHIVDGMNVVIEGANAAMFTRTFDGWSNKTGGNINIVYTPTATGTHTATLKITSGAVVKTVTLNGTAADMTPTITVAPETLTQFQSVVGTASAAQTVTVTAANLTADMAITITGTNAAMFTKTAGAGWSDRTGGEISIVYTPTAEGNHTATLTITSGSITKTITLNGNGTVGVNELEANTNIFAYDKTITVELEDVDNANIAVFNIAGKLVAEKSVDSNVTKIDVNSNAGIYIVRVTANGNIIAKKVVIK